MIAIYLRGIMFISGVYMYKTLSSINTKIQGYNFEEFPMSFNSTKITSEALFVCHRSVLIYISVLFVGNIFYKIFEMRSEASRMMKETNHSKPSFFGMFLSQFFSITTLFSGYFICYYLASFLKEQYTTDNAFAYENIDNLLHKNIIKKDLPVINTDISLFLKYSTLMIIFEFFRFGFDICMYMQSSKPIDKKKFNRMMNTHSVISKNGDREAPDCRSPELRSPSTHQVLKGNYESEQPIKSSQLSDLQFNSGKNT